MVSRPSEAQSRNSLVKNVQTIATFAPQAIPGDAVMLAVLKTIENQLIQRGMLRIQANAACNPLWFAAETERNVFLWRHGYSVADADKFEFWVRPVQLIEKRLNQLDLFEAGNPFVNADWGNDASETSGGADEEIYYLDSLREMMQRIVGHAHALSYVGQELEQEFLGAKGETRPAVVLPYR